MGQFALGIRSLLIKVAVFIVMAALLAWALGGTLFPRPARAEFEAATFAGHEWIWRLSVPYRRPAPDDSGVRWELLYRDARGDTHVLDVPPWAEKAGPVTRGERMCFAGRAIHSSQGASSAGWTFVTVDSSLRIVETIAVPDRLSVEQRLAELATALNGSIE
jgi:hypothetical protein